MLALKRENIDFKQNVIHVKTTLTRDEKDRPIEGNGPKTEAGIRDVPLTKHLKQIFMNNINMKYLFTKPDGSFIATSTINSHFKKIAKDAHIREIIYQVKRDGKVINLRSSMVTTHMLRKTFCTRCMEQGMKPKALQAIMGHSDIGITMNIYAKADNKFKASEMEMVEEGLKAINLM